MEEILHNIAHHLALVLEAIALLVIAGGALEALLGAGKVFASRNVSDAEKRAIWIHFARWLSAGLTFQLAADIVNTTISSGWDSIGRVAAIAAIRTFLTFFLDRDMEAMRERERA
jgi:uncharacterized membrane protein